MSEMATGLWGSSSGYDDNDDDVGMSQYQLS